MDAITRTNARGGMSSQTGKISHYQNRGEGDRMRLIDADALLKKIEEDAEFYLVGDDENSMAVGGALLSVMEQIKTMPTIEPQRMRGRWIDGYLNEYHTARIATCSCCGYDGVPAVKEYNFCPNCGAWMEGQDETRGVSETT